MPSRCVYENGAEFDMGVGMSNNVSMRCANGWQLASVLRVGGCSIFFRCSLSIETNHAIEMA
jgi:hypothetical protein